MAGGSIETLREVLGHSSVVVTERYAPVSTDLFGQADLTRVVVDLSAPTGKILPTRDIGGTVSKPDHSKAGVAKWYTQRTQNPPPARAYEFKSRLRHREIIHKYEDSQNLTQRIATRFAPNLHQGG